MKSKICFLLMLLLPFLNAWSQNKTVTGKVTNTTGTAIPGVTVTQKGTSNATQTSEQGTYSISVTGNPIVLSFTSVAHKAEDVTVGDRTKVDISLSDTTAVLSDVVVIGYGNQNRKNLTSSIVTVKPEDFNRGAITDVGQLMQGKVAGLNITASGNPNQAASVVLRGASTLNSSQSPFYVIDGIPGADISILAPDDIASIDVLKDAAATAIYGNRAANGVIMVTTKKGKKGGAMVSYHGYIGVEKVANRLEMMDADELRKLLTANGQAFSPADDKGANTDWQNEVQRESAVSQNHNLSMSGGSATTTYSASINYAKKEGIMRFSDLERIIVRLALEQSAIKDKLKLSLMLNNSNSKANNVPMLNTVLTQMIRYLPVSPVRNADGTYFENFSTVNSYNPVALMEQAQDNMKTNVLVGSFGANLKLPWGLTYDLNIFYQNYGTLRGEYYNSYYSKYSALGNFGTNGLARRSAYQNTNKVLETFLSWNRKFGEHSINAVLGYSWQENISGEGFQASTTNFPVDNIAYNNFALSNPYAIGPFRVDFGPDGIYQKVLLISDFMRVNYNFRDKYLLQASIRRDGSSVFGTNNKWGYFPSVGASWRISQEGFMSGQKLFTDLKLRASYGVTGNSTGFNAYTAQIMSGGLGTFYYNGNYQAAYGPTQADNPDLAWEKTTTVNIGVDFTTLKGKLSGSLELYDKNTDGMIYGYNANPALIPTGRITANGGSMNNRGIELTLNATPVTTSKFRWNTSFNIAHNDNEITSLTNPLFAGGDSVRITSPNGQGQTGSTIQILKSGKPVGQFFTLQYAGKNASGISQYYDNKGALTITPRIGTDYAYVSTPQPTVLAGWSNTIRYSNWDLNFFLRGSFGNKIFNATRADLFRPSTAQYSNILKDAAGESISDVNVFKYSTRFIELGNYVRLDNATLGYNFKNMGQVIRTLRVYVSANNLFVITNYKGIDPEISQGGLSPGYDNNNFYPRTRTFLFGANVSF